MCCRLVECSSWHGSEDAMMEVMARAMECVWTSMLRPTLDGVQGPNLDSFESNWILVLDPSLHLGSFKSWDLLFSSFFGWNQLIFLPKCCHVNLALICCFSVLDSHLKAVGPIYSLSSNRIALFFFDPGSSSSFKVALRREDMKKMVFGIRAYEWSYLLCASNLWLSK